MSASLDDITNAIGITKPAVYYYFEAKEDILFEICMTQLNSLQKKAEVIAASDLELPDKVAKLFANHMLQFHEQRDCAETYLREAAHLSLERRKIVSNTLKQYETYLRQHVDQAISQGIFRPVDSKLVVRGIGGMLNWLGNWYTPEGQCDIEYIIAAHINFIMHGLLADPDKDGAKYNYCIENKDCLA